MVAVDGRSGSGIIVWDGVPRNHSAVHGSSLSAYKAWLRGGTGAGVSGGGKGKLRIS